MLGDVLQDDSTRMTAPQTAPASAPDYGAETIKVLKG
jgi:hypothetical protein